MNWIALTLTNGKPTLVDLSKVLYITTRNDGCTLHLQHDSVNAKGKAVPFAVGVQQSIEFLTKELRARKLA